MRIDKLINLKRYILDHPEMLDMRTGFKVGVPDTVLSNCRSNTRLTKLEGNCETVGCIAGLLLYLEDLYLLKPSSKEKEGYEIVVQRDGHYRGNSKDFRSVGTTAQQLLEIDERAFAKSYTSDYVLWPEECRLFYLEHWPKQLADNYYELRFALKRLSPSENEAAANLRQQVASVTGEVIDWFVNEFGSAEEKTEWATLHKEKVNE